MLILRSSRRIQVFALDAGPDAPPILRTKDRRSLRDGTLVGEAVIFVDETGGLFRTDAKGEQQLLGKFEGVPLLAVSADRKRAAVGVAVGSRSTIAIWNDRGRRVAQLATTGGSIQALAWSPDLRTLAVSARGGVELWTFRVSDARP